MGSVHEVDQALSPSDGLEITVASFWMMVACQDKVPLFPEVGSDFWICIQSKTYSSNCHSLLIELLHVREHCKAL